jgi:hypothetical protein
MNRPRLVPASEARVSLWPWMTSLPHHRKVVSHNGPTYPRTTVLSSAWKGALPSRRCFFPPDTPGTASGGRVQRMRLTETAWEAGRGQQEQAQAEHQCHPAHGDCVADHWVRAHIRIEEGGQQPEGHGYDDHRVQPNQTRRRNPFRSSRRSWVSIDIRMEALPGHPSQ